LCARCATALLINKPFAKGEQKQKMKKGTVKFFNEAKGFGFIKEDGGQEIFVHVTGLKEEIRENDQVVFEVENGKKGLNAINVSIAQ
jgi:CspA family cold shock protein